MQCPSCGSNDGDRISRSFLNKLFLRKRKFICRKCRAVYFAGNYEEPPTEKQSSDSLS